MFEFNTRLTKVKKKLVFVIPFDYIENEFAKEGDKFQLICRKI